jgi:hypothetical protein
VFRRVATFVAALCNLSRWPLQLAHSPEVITALGDDVTLARANYDHWLSLLSHPRNHTAWYIRHETANVYI